MHQSCHVRFIVCFVSNVKISIQDQRLVQDLLLFLVTPHWQDFYLEGFGQMRWQSTIC